MQKYDKSISHFLKAKDIYTAALGVDHPRGCHAVEGLAKAYHAKGHTSKARMLMMDVVRIRLSKLGAQHASYRGSKAFLDKLHEPKSVQVAFRKAVINVQEWQRVRRERGAGAGVATSILAERNRRVICPFICSTFQVTTVLVPIVVVLVPL